MNNVKFSSLSTASYLSGSDYITIVRSGSATQSDTGIAPNNYIVQAQYFTSSWANNARTSSYFNGVTASAPSARFGSANRYVTIQDLTSGQMAIAMNGSDGNLSRITTDQNHLWLNPATEIIKVGVQGMFFGKMSATYGHYGVGQGYGITCPTTTTLENISTDVNTDNFVLNHNSPGQGRYLLNVIDNGTSRLMISGSGNVGIGTTSPNTKLAVIGDVAIGTPSAIALPSGLPAATTLSIMSTGTSYGTGILARRGGDFYTGFNLWNYSYGTYLDDYYDDTNAKMYFRLRTAGTPVTAMTLAASGNVGIGTTSPTNKLSISGSVNEPTIVINSSNGIGNWNGIRFGSGYGASHHEKAGIFFKRINSAADGDLHFAMAPPWTTGNMEDDYPANISHSIMVISSSGIVTFTPTNLRNLTPGLAPGNGIGPSSASMEIRQYRTTPDGIQLKLAGIQALAGNLYSPSVGFGVGNLSSHGAAIESLPFDVTGGGLTIDPTALRFAVGSAGPDNINSLYLTLSTANVVPQGTGDQISSFDLKTIRSGFYTHSPSLTISAKDIDLLTGVNYSGGRVSGLYISASGLNGIRHVGLGTTSPSHQLTLSTDSAKKPTSNVWDTVSDERIKTDIVPADLSRCYEIVKQVGLKHFGFKPGVYNDGQIKDKHTLGFIAQDVQKVFGKAVSVSPFTLQTDIPDGIEEYEEQDFTLETVDKVETLIQVINGKPVQVSKVVTSENKVMLFDMVDVLDESGVAVMESYEVTPAIRAIDATEEVEAVESIEAVMGTRPVTYKMPRMITKTRPKVRYEVIEDCLNLNSGQMNAALYGAVQCLMAKVEAQAVIIAALQTKVGE